MLYLGPLHLFAIILNAVLYGAYTVLVVLCIYVLLTRKSMGYKWHLSCTLALFFLITMVLVTCVLLISLWNASGTRRLPVLYVLYGFGVLGSHLLADIVLIQRCYIIWGCRKRVIMLPSVLLVLNVVAGGYEIWRNGFLAPGLLPPNRKYILYDWALFMAFYTICLATNTLATGLTAGRIWYLTKTSSMVLGHRIKGKYNKAVAIILESGMIYSGMLLVLIVIMSIITRTLSIVLGGILSAFVPIVVQCSGIMPTLIIVRAGLGGNGASDVVNSNSIAMYGGSPHGPRSSDGIFSSVETPVIDIGRTRCGDDENSDGKVRFGSDSRIFLLNSEPNVRFGPRGMPEL